MERVNVNNTKAQLFDQLIGVNKQIKENLGKKRQEPAGSFESEIFHTLTGLYTSKNRLIVNALELRIQGEKGIALELMGRKEDLLHSYSRNDLCVVIASGSTYRIGSDLMHLRSVFAGDILTLIDNPERYIEESWDKYIIRTSVEMNAISHAVDKFNRDSSEDGFMREVSLSRLKVDLAKRLLRLRVEGIVSAEELEIAYLRDRRSRVDSDLIEINYFHNSQKWGSHLLGSEYNRNIGLQKLIDDCGGFDRKGRRKKHY